MYTHTHTHTHTERERESTVSLISFCKWNSSIFVNWITRIAGSVMLAPCCYPSYTVTIYTTNNPSLSSVWDCVRLSHWVCLHGHEYPGYDWLFEVLCFWVCTCKHHVPFSETWISPYPVSEKPKYAIYSTLKETGILLHVYIQVSDCHRLPAQARLQPSYLTETQTMAAAKASHSCSGFWQGWHLLVGWSICSCLTKLSLVRKSLVLLS